MKWHWKVALSATLISAALAGLVPTTDTMVVARTDEGVTPDVVSDQQTEDSTLPIKLTEMDVRSEVTMRYAHTSVVATMRNPAKKAQEANFRVLLPETAFISGFTMILDGKPYKAYVKGKEEASKIYNDAVSHGQGAAHVATKARDSNHFTIAVNVEPNSVAVFNLTYEELLVRRNGVYNHVVNLHPGALVPKLTVTVHIKEVQKISQLRVPAIRTGNEIDDTEEDSENTKAIISKSDNEVTITFSPDLKEQQRLMEIYAEKAKQNQQSPLGYSQFEFEKEQKEKNEGVLGQFVVQYDVERSPNGEILVNDGYFVHFYTPASLPTLSKHVVFVLDTSGSMLDRKITQLISAMETILADLGEHDYFNIVEFDSFAKVHDLTEAEGPPLKKTTEWPPHRYQDKPRAPTLVPPARASEENKSRAKKIVSRLIAAGGTNIFSALDLAVDLVQKGVQATATDEQKEENSDNDKDGKQLEPIIIFLTDGDPTIGETSPKKILNHITEKNSGPNRATIFSLSFGDDADRAFLRKLSLRNEGFMRHIYEAADAALQLRNFYREVSSPLLAHVKFVYPPDQVKEGSVTKHTYRALYLGAEAVVAGRVSDSEVDVEFAPRVEGFCGATGGGRKKYEIFPKLPVERKTKAYLPLERLWAYLTIQQLLEQRDTLDMEEKEDGPSKKALELALKYSFVTPLTSLVVVKPNATAAVDAESVDNQAIRAPGSGGGGAGQPACTSSVFHPTTNRPSPAYHFQKYPSVADQYQNVALDEAPDYEIDEETEELVISSPAPDPLERFNLSAYWWVEDLIDYVDETIRIESKNVTLKLSTGDPLERASSDEECAHAVSVTGADPESGACVYVTRCSAAVAITAELYVDTYCSVEGYAGICCPKSSVKERRT